MKQMTFADADAGKCKQTCKDLFLTEMEQMVPWQA